MPALAAFAAQRLEQVRTRNLFRVRQPLSAGRDTQGRAYRIFCSNDYLGLAGDPRLVEAMQKAVQQYGVGSGASQYVSGFHPEQQALEAELADLLGRERALVFGAGYLANPGVIDALVGRGDQIYSDALNHASLIDGCRLSGAQVHSYAHGDLAALESQLQQHGPGNQLIVSDAVFSMDGDSADIAALSALAEQQQAWLLLDDAHGFGVLGAQGAGSVAAAGLATAAVPLVTGTMGKALGVYGAFVAGDDPVIEMLVQSARTAIFTTALPPALLATARCALQLLRREEWRRSQLQTLIAQFRAGLAARELPLSSSLTPIQPLVVGAEERALALSAALREQGFWVTAIRPPTVPRNTARLRITLSAAHGEQDVSDLLDALAAAWAATLHKPA